jgi:hypothetical protein
MPGRAAKFGWIDGIVTTYNYRLMHRKEMQQAVKSCAKAGIGLVAIKSQAAMDRTALSFQDMELLKNYANETLSCYCAGCARICESVALNHIPIAKVMRCLMYYHAYNDHEKARSCYHRLPMEIRQEIATADYSVAELKCPNRLAIGELLRMASLELA